MNRLVPVFPPEQRSGLGIMGQCAVFAVALAGHVSVALAMMPIWTTKPVISTGDPPPAIFAEIVPASRGSLESPLDSQAGDVVEPHDAQVANDATSDVSVDAAAPVNASPSPTSHSAATKSLVKPARSKTASDQIVRLNATAKTRTRDPAWRETGSHDPAADPTHQTFGHTAAVTDLPSTWKSKLLAHLERFKRYPEAAKSRHEEGTSLLSFTLDRQGRVLSFFVARSSGSDALDTAAQALIERASPVPPMPDDVSGQTAQLVVPIRFTVR